MLPYLVSEVRVEGESQIPESTGKVRRVWLEPIGPPAYPQAIQAILSADLIVTGPGSLFTSIIPNLLVPDIADAIRASKALKLYVCNVATEPGETDQYSSQDHIRALENHAGGGLFDIAIVNNNFLGNLPQNVDWVCMGEEPDESYLTYQNDLIDQEFPWRHDGDKLAQVVIDLLEERTGPFVD
jgi:uncharacterized cofD-like protein